MTTPKHPRSLVKTGLVVAAIFIFAISVYWKLGRQTPTTMALGHSSASTPNQKQEDKQSGSPKLNSVAKNKSASTTTTSTPTGPGSRANASTTQSLALTEPAEPEEDIDYATHYILINGHHAHPSRLLAKYKTTPPTQTLDPLLESFELRASHVFPLTPKVAILKSTKGVSAPVANAEDARIQGERMQERIKALMGTGLFEYVEPDYIQSIDTVPTDSSFTDGTLWGLRNTGQSSGVAGADIDVVRAWSTTTGSTDVIVAVIDTGIRYTHQDLTAQMWRNPGEIPDNGIDDDGDGYVDNVFGINAVTNSGNPMDDHGHGTHVSGTIGASANGGGQHVGVAWSVQLMACRFMSLTSTGGASGSTSDAIKCINFAVSKGARILSNSWGGGGFSQALSDAIAAARDNNVLFIAAAGNDGLNNDTTPSYPASYPLDNIISVAALDRQDKLASFSNYGLTSVHIGAPGVSIFSSTSASDTSYATWSGTSMATPHVAGVAALVLANAPDITMGDLRERILSGAIPISALTGKSTTGGRLNAYNALIGEPDGTLEVSVLPYPGSEIMGGTNVSFFVHVRDFTGVNNATVTATITGMPDVTFTNDGVAPDVTANNHIYSASISVPSTSSSFSLQLTVSAPDKTTYTTTCTYPVRLPPANDNFASRTAIASVPSSLTGSNLGATKETGEPNHAGYTGGKSVWWSWTATANGTGTVSTVGSNFDTILAVYTGTTLAGLTRVASDDDSGGSLTSLVSFAVTTGTTYQIAVDGYGASSGNITLNTSFVAAPLPPANDDFANASVLSGMSATATGANQTATKETGEPNHAGNTGGHSVWWSWTAPVSGTATITTDGSLLDTTLGIYVGTSVSSLTTIASDNDSGEGTRSQASFSAVAGTTYRIAVDGYNGSIGTIALAISLVVSPPAPANDNFSDRIVLTGTIATATGTNIGASKETSEPDHAQNSGGKSVWWTWTAPSSGTAVITTAGSNFDSLLAVYTGTTLTDLTAISSNDQDPLGGNTSRVIFNVTAGTTYQIAVDGVNSGLNIALGSITLNVTLSATNNPLNDYFALRTPITGASATVTGSNVGATAETGEPAHYGTASKSVWWSWTAPTTGTAIINTDGSPFDTVLAIYTGTVLTSLTKIGSDDDSGAGFDSQLIFAATAGTTYQIAVDGLSGGSGSITLNVNPVIPPPVITSQPGNLTNYLGDTLYLYVSATSSTPMTYQWKKDGVALVNGTRISGATSNYLYINNAVIADSGQYTVVITNTTGPTTSNAATVTVSIPPVPVITTQPMNQNVYPGDYSAFSVSISSLGATTYQWQKSTDNGVTFTNILNATYSYISFYSTQTTDAGQYRVIITNGGGSVTSNAATLTVNIPAAPVIMTQPANRNLYPGDTINLSVVATITGATSYQWQKSTDNGVTFTNLTYSNYTNYSLYSAQFSDAGQYRVLVTNAGGTTTSIAAIVTINTPPAPVITTQPATQSVYLGNSINFSVGVTATGTTAYQWQKSTDNGVTFTNISYATYSYYNIYNSIVTDAAQYRVIVTNAGGSTTSSVATITFVTPPPPVITYQPTNQTVYLGETIYLSVGSNNTGTTTYQWQRSIDNGVTFTNVANGTSNYLYVNNSTLSDAGPFRVIVTNPGGSTTSNSVTVTFLTPPPPTISTQPTGTSVQGGNSFYLYGYASGRGSIAYQWQKDGVNLTNGTRISGATSYNLSISNALLADAGQYRLIASNAGGSVTSNAATVSVTAPPPPTIYSQPSSNTVTAGNSTSFYVYASGAGLTYQWQKNGVNLINDTRISGANTYSLYFNNTQTSDAGSYTVVVANEGGSITSTAATLTVTIPTPPTFYTQPTDITVLEGTALNLYGYASSSGSITYQWYKNSTAISGATSYNFSKTVTILTDAGLYKLAATNGGGTTYSREATVTVTPATAPVFVIHPQSQNAYVGDIITLTAAATANPAATYQWYKNGTALSAATSNSLTLASLLAANDGDVYTVRATNIAGNVTSNGATLSVFAVDSGRAVGLAPATRTVGCGRVVYPLVLRMRGTWTATTNANWIQLSATSGTNNRSLEVIVAPNPLPTERTTTITIGQQTHTLTQRAAGTPISDLWAVGANDFGQLGDYRIPPNTYPAQADTQVQTIAAGANHTLYLKTDGTLFACGDNRFGQLGNGTTVTQNAPVQIATSVQAIAAGVYHSAFLKQDGTLWTVGYNNYGQLGDGSTASHSTPVQIATGVAKIAASGYQTFFIKSDATLWATGYNSEGQLGDSSLTNYSTPVQIASGVATVAAGGRHTLFVKSDGTLWATGRNTENQLGNGNTSNVSTPVQVSTNVKAASCGQLFSLFLKNDNSLYGMGSGSAGQLGLGYSYGSNYYPLSITTNVLTMAAGANHTLIVKTDNTLWATGDNLYYKLGNGTTTNQYSPVNIASGVQSVAAGGDHSLFIKTDGTLWAAGSNFYGQLGNASAGVESRATPICVASEVQSAAAGDNHSLYLKNDGTCWTVGDNSAGQLADGGSTTRYNPQSIATGIKSVATGYSHSFLLKTDGTLFAAGANASGQLGDGTTTLRSNPVQVATDIVSVSAGSNHSLLQKTDGRLFATGSNSWGQLGDTSYSSYRWAPIQVNTNVRSTSAGYMYSLHVKTDNSLWVCGYNSVGQLGNGSTFYQSIPALVNGAYLAASAGYGHSLFLKTDNTVWTVGDNTLGQLGNGSNLTSYIPTQVATGVQAIAAGQYHSLWIKTDNTLMATGDGSSGQLGSDSYTSRSQPVAVAASVQSISAGGAHSLFIANGDVRTSFTPPVITGFTPAAPVAGASVTINGSGFNNVLGVYFNNIPATSYTTSSSTQVVAVVPSADLANLHVTIGTFDGVATSDNSSSSSSSSSGSGSSSSSSSSSGGGGGGAMNLWFLATLGATTLARFATVFARRR